MSLYPFVGMDESGELHIYISPFKLYKFGPMHLRGKPPPSGCVGKIEPENSDAALKRMLDYFNDYDGRTKKK